MSAPDNASLSAPKLPLAQGAVIHVALFRWGDVGFPDHASANNWLMNCISP
jgi:hypothetical protein